MLTEEQRFEHLRSIADPNIYRLLHDYEGRIQDLESDRRLRGLAVSLAIGAGPIIVGIAAILFR